MKSLRPYQQQAIDAISNGLKRGVDKQLLVMSMGLGKTYTAVKAIEQLGFKRVAWVTDSEDLLSQSALAFIRDKFDDRLYNHIKEVGFLEYVKNGGTFTNSGFSMGAIKSDVFKPEGNVCMISAQTLWRRLDKLDPDMFDAVIIDEAHCFGAARLYEGINFLRSKLRLGLTGTPERYDGVMMGDIFDEIIFEYGMAQGIRDGYLAELDGVRIKTNISLDGVHSLAGELNQSELSQEVNCLARNNLIASSYLKYAKGRRAVGYAVDIQHALDLAETFNQYGIKATAVSSDEERTGDRTRKIKDYANGKYDVLFNVNLLVKGWDDPDTGCGIMACPTKSKVKYLQSVGRPGRLKSPEYVSKFGQNAIILDIVDLTSKHSLVNTWTLDKELPPEDRTFITSENREKLLEARRIRIEGKYDKDERIQLLPVLTPRFRNNIAARELATEPQLKFLQDLGYNIRDNTYTREQCREILGGLPAKKSDLEELKNLGVDISSPITRNQASYTIWAIKNKKYKTHR